MKVLNQGMEKNLAKYHGEGSSNLGSEGVQAISSHLSIRIRPIGRVERSAESGTIKRRGANYGLQDYKTTLLSTPSKCTEAKPLTPFIPDKRPLNIPCHRSINVVAPVPRNQERCPE
jgi:hypothetical protein